jgi:hypothetical protein
MYIYLFKISCWSEDDVEKLRQIDLNTMMSNPENKGSWYSIYTESTDFDTYEIPFDKMKIQPSNSPEDLKCNYDSDEEVYNFLIALKTEEVLYQPAFIANVISGTAFDGLYLMYPATVNGEETVCYEQFVDGQWDEGYFIGSKDMSCVGNSCAEILGISPLEDFINPENYS